MQREDPNEYVRRAEKILKPGLFGKLFGSSDARNEEALDCYKIAGNLFKLNKDFLNAGKCYEKCALIEEKLGGLASAVNYKNASTCYQFCDKKKSDEMIDKAIRIYQLNQKYLEAANLISSMADQFERDKLYKTAIKYYNKAIELYRMELSDNKNKQHNCQLKVADMYCMLSNKFNSDIDTEGIVEGVNMEDISIGKAGEIYDTIASDWATLPMKKYNAIDLFYKAVICYIAIGDEITAEILYEKYQAEASHFAETHECKFLAGIIKLFKEPPVEAEALTKQMEFVNVYKANDAWSKNMFSYIFNNLKSDDDDLK